jgi:hypothetical protein
MRGERDPRAVEFRVSNTRGRIRSQFIAEQEEEEKRMKAGGRGNVNVGDGRLVGCAALGFGLRRRNG